MSIRKCISLGFGFAVSVAFLWLISQSLSIDDFLAALSGANPFWMFVALSCFVLGYCCRIWRWRMMLMLYNPSLSWRRCSMPFTISIAANNVLPFRAGDVLRGVAFSKSIGVPTAHVLATLLVERLLDILMLIMALAAALLTFRVYNAGVLILFNVSVGGFLLFALFIFLVLFFPRFFQAPIRWLFSNNPFQNNRLFQKLEAQVDTIFQALSDLADRSRMAKLMLWSVFAWLFEASVFFAVARGLSSVSVPEAAWVAMPVGTLSTMLPSTPGYVGTFHYFVMKVLEGFGNTEASAVAFAFLVHLTLFVPATLWGGISFVYWSLTRKVRPTVADQRNAEL